MWCNVWKICSIHWACIQHCNCMCHIHFISQPGISVFTTEPVRGFVVAWEQLHVLKLHQAPLFEVCLDSCSTGTQACHEFWNACPASSTIHSGVVWMPDCVHCVHMFHTSLSWWSVYENYPQKSRVWTLLHFCRCDSCFSGCTSLVAQVCGEIQASTDPSHTMWSNTHVTCLVMWQVPEPSHTLSTKPVVCFQVREQPAHLKCGTSCNYVNQCDYWFLQLAHVWDCTPVIWSTVYFFFSCFLLRC